MRVVLDSNVFISSLISQAGPPHSIYLAWRAKRFTLVTSDAQIAELRRASRYPKLTALVRSRDFGALLNRLHGAELLQWLPDLEIAKDSDDNWLLATAQAGKADFLVTGDARHLLLLKKLGRTRIVMLADFLEVMARRRSPRHPRRR